MVNILSCDACAPWVLSPACTRYTGSSPTRIVHIPHVCLLLYRRDNSRCSSYRIFIRQLPAYLYVLISSHGLAFDWCALHHVHCIDWQQSKWTRAWHCIRLQISFRSVFVKIKKRKDRRQATFDAARQRSARPVFYLRLQIKGFGIWIHFCCFCLQARVAKNISYISAVSGTASNLLVMR